MKYPEHEKMKSVKTQSQAIGEFVEWLEGEGIFLARYREGRDYMDTVPERIESLLARHFEIDLKKIDAEKDAMLDEMREANKV